MTNPSKPDARRSGTRWLVVILGTGTLAASGIAGAFVVHSLRLHEAAMLTENETIARAVAGSIQARQAGYRDVLLAYARRPRLSEAIKRRDHAEALAHLGQLREALRELDQPFLADPAGMLWAAVPEEPQNYGKSFAHRDWYQGVSREWRPYTSEVFRLATQDQALAVVLAVRMILPPDDKAQKHLAILDSEVGTADRIVSELLDFARATPSNRIVTDVTALVRDVLGRASLDGHVTVATRLDARCPAISVDPEQLKQILGNLITNAIQAMPDGGALTVEADGGTLITVSDTGVGISPDHLGEIFEPFLTTKAKGIGLGLTRVKDLVEANGGTIEVESAPGRGSRFLVRFPGVATPGKKEVR